MNVNSELCSPNNSHNNSFSAQMLSRYTMVRTQHMFCGDGIKEQFGFLRSLEVEKFKVLFSPPQVEKCMHLTK